MENCRNAYRLVANVWPILAAEDLLGTFSTSDSGVAEFKRCPVGSVSSAGRISVSYFAFSAEYQTFLRSDL